MKKRQPVPWGIIAGGALAFLGGVGLLFLGRKQLVLAGKFLFDTTKAQLFKLSLPARIGQWSSQILAAAQEYSVSPFALAAIMDGESRGGDALIPRGPGGTGDYIPRKPTVGSVKSLPAGATRDVSSTELLDLRRRGLITEQMLTDMQATLASGGKLVLPSDGKGWGRGLSQLDYGAHYDWVRSNNWADPSVALRKMASILRNDLDYLAKNVGAGATVTVTIDGKPTKLADPRPLAGDALSTAAIAAYNAGAGRVLSALARGQSPDTVTFRPGYTGKIISAALSFLSTFEGKAAGS